jgi:hypothetical protein
MKFLLTGLMLWFFTTRAQTEDKAKAAGGKREPVKKSCPCSFSSIEQGGVLRGPYSSYFQAQTINGIRYKTWFAGVGAGLDFYRYKGVPIFLDVRKHFFKSKYSPFIYADGGIHLAGTNNEKSQFVTTKYKNGFYYDVGLGYKVNVTNKTGFLISAGYSYKQVVYRQFFHYCPACFPPNSTLDTHSFYLNRLSLKMGWQF